MGFRVVQMLLEKGIAISFLTKGIIPECFFELFVKHPDMVQARIGLLTTNEQIIARLEPGAASVATRLSQAKRLVAMGIPTAMRADPIIPGITDDDATFDELCRRIAETGVRDLAASILFLRPAITSSLQRMLAETDWFSTIQSRFEQSCRLPIHAEHSVVKALPPEERRNIFDRLARLAKHHDLQLHLCACKNPDLAASSCLIAGKWEEVSQAMLF